METKAFPIEFHAETKALTDALKAKVAQRLTKLAKGHHDITGAFVALEEVPSSNTPHEFKARVVLYSRPANVSATVNGEQAWPVLTKALDATERQVRDNRSKRRGR